MLFMNKNYYLCMVQNNVHGANLRIMKQTIFTLFFAICLAVVHAGFAQSIAKSLLEDIKRAVPPSPEVASLGKYGEIPVNMHSGIPEISISLYELKGQDLYVPISLSYHGGGFKVAEVASSVGLGWILNAGGVIARTVRGWPDECGNGYYNSANIYNTLIKDTPVYYLSNCPFSCLYRKKMVAGEVDLEPDDFYFNFNGYSGRIIFNEDRQPIFFPYQNLKIEGSVTDDWIITIPDGTKYYFEQTEISVFRYGINYISAWYLTRIESAKTDEVITYEYEYNGVDWGDNLNDTREFTRYLNLISDPYSSYTEQRICETSFLNQEIEMTSTVRLRQINFPKQGILISLKYAEDREDVAPYQSQPRFTRLDVLINSDTLRSFDFTHGYFQGKPNMSYTSSYELKRLKLLTVENRINHTKYSFDYEETHQMPAYKSPSIDHWGYYNNATNITYLGDIPRGVIIPPAPLSFHQKYHIGFNPSCNRETDSEAVKACMLKKITYPTGGYTSFSWEANMVSYTNTSTIVTKTPQVNCYSGTITMSSQGQYLANYINNDDPTDDIGKPIKVDMVKFNVDMSGGCYAKVTINQETIVGYRKVFIYKIVPNGSYIPIHPTINPLKDLNIPGCTEITYKNNQTVYLTQGAYFLIAIISKNSHAQQPLTASLNFEDEKVIPYSDQLVGGVRIREICSHDGLGSANDVVKTYSYKKNYLEPLESQSYSRSSGRLFLDPYYSNYKYYYEHKCTEGMLLTSFLVDEYGVPSREKGSHIGYAEVTEETKGLQGGIKTMIYNNGVTEEMRNLLIAEKIYDAQLNPVRITSNTYTTYSVQGSYTFYQTVLLEAIRTYAPLGHIEHFTFIDILNNFYSTLWSGLKETRIKTYDLQDENRFVEEVIQYEYQGAIGAKHIMPTQKTFLNSAGSTRIEKIRYPRDFTNPTGIIYTLQNIHCVHLPVEEQIYKDSKLISSHYAGYGNLGYGKIALKELYEWDFSKEQSYINGIDNSSGSLTSNTSYRNILSLERENTTGNLLTQIPTDNPPLAFLWGHNNSKPVVKIENLTYQEISSGIKTAIRNYTFSAGNTVNEIQQDIFFLRTQLAGINVEKPFMATLYTYNWMGNLASMTDPAGKTIYYEYDDFGRLKTTKDHEGNILQRHDYNYGKQQ
jgi:YD repeat-containing protein